MLINCCVIVGIIDMDIRARCHYLTLSLLIQGRKELAYVALRDISAKMWMNKQQMEVQAQLKRIKLNYPLSSDNLYPQIVRTLSDEVLSLHYIAYQQWKKEDVEGRDMDVQLSLGAVQVVFLNKFVTEISSFFAGFESAQAKLKQVSSSAAESAKQTVQNAYQEAVRIKLKVAIRAPIVIMPSTHAVPMPCWSTWVLCWSATPSTLPPPAPASSFPWTSFSSTLPPSSSAGDFQCLLVLMMVHCVKAVCLLQYRHEGERAASPQRVCPAVPAASHGDDGAAQPQRHGAARGPQHGHQRWTQVATDATEQVSQSSNGSLELRCQLWAFEQRRLCRHHGRPSRQLCRGQPDHRHAAHCW